MKYTAQLKPTDNPRIDTRPTDIVWRDNVNQKLKMMSQTPYNSPVNITQNLKIHGATFYDSTFATYSTLKLISFFGGFYSTTFVPADKINFLKSSERQRLAQTNEIVLSIDCTFMQNYDYTPFSPATASSDYTVNLYVSLSASFQSPTASATGDQTNIQFNDLLVSIPIEFSYTLTTDSWTVTNPSQDFRLSDYIPRRGVTANLDPDFSSDPTQITKSQWDLLRSQNSRIVVQAGWATDEISALSASNQSHFDDYFNHTATTDCYYIPDISCTLNYYGLTADYIPTNI